MTEVVPRERIGDIAQCLRPFEQARFERDAPSLRGDRSQLENIDEAHFRGQPRNELLFAACERIRFLARQCLDVLASRAVWKRN